MSFPIVLFSLLSASPLLGIIKYHQLKRWVY